MSNVTVRKSNGDILEVTLLTLFGMLADEPPANHGQRESNLH
jgi:hypothetical protein